MYEALRCKGPCNLSPRLGVEIADEVSGQTVTIGFASYQLRRPGEKISSAYVLNSKTAARLRGIVDGNNVREVSIGDSGDLLIRFVDDYVVSVRSDERYESWAIYRGGDDLTGRLWCVGMPGGDVARFSG